MFVMVKKQDWHTDEDYCQCSQNIVQVFIIDHVVSNRYDTNNVYNQHEVCPILAGFTSRHDVLQQHLTKSS